MNKFEVDTRQSRMPSASKRAAYYDDVPNEFVVTYTPIKAGIYNIYLFDIIEEASQFINAIEVMSSATENDEVHIHLSSGGGSLDATDTFLASMNRCDAKIKAFVSGGCHSAATIILLNVDEFNLSENANFLIHNGSTGSGGKYSDFKAQSKHTSMYMERVLRNTYKHFLSDTELDALIEGKDFWLDADEFGNRYEARNTALMEEFEAEQEELLPLLEAVEKPARILKKAAQPS